MDEPVKVADNTVKLPRVAITYCTQCRWMLRAAYFGQELLSTFGTSIGEIALIPATGGIFTVHLTYRAHTNDGGTDDVVLWDRKVEGGFPEAKILKQRLRNHIEPDKKLGHSDTPSSKSTPSETAQKSSAKVKPDESNITAERSALDAPAVPSKVADCEDCT